MFKVTKNEIISAVLIFQSHTMRSMVYRLADFILRGPFLRCMAAVILFIPKVPTLPAQNYTSFLTGSPVDTITFPAGGICMMGGATEHDEAMKWFLTRAAGGDVLVLRTSGSDGYNSYMYNDLGITLNSVETIVCHNAMASTEPMVMDKIAKAEAIWFAGGDQWDYISWWRNTPVDSLIRKGIAERNIVIGGTSAGMAILGGCYFTAENGTVTSAQALADPYDYRVRPDSALFLGIPHLQNTITDTHYDSPDRKGRHTVFLARMMKDYAIQPRGIACDEYTAICMDTSGTARIFGDYPDFDDNAYFISANCELPDPSPETCVPGTALEWNLSGKALNVYQVKGTFSGSNTFNLQDWESGIGGVWQQWFVTGGVLTETTGTAPDCLPVQLEQAADVSGRFWPNPFRDELNIEAAEEILSIRVLNASGILLAEKSVQHPQRTVKMVTAGWPEGIYVAWVILGSGTETSFKLVLQR